MKNKNIKEKEVKSEIVKPKNKFLIISNIILILVILVLSSFIIFDKLKDGGIIISRDKNEDYKFTSPILDCEYAHPREGVFGLLSHYNEEIESIKNKYNLKNVSLYLRDLRNGPWIGVNEQEIFSPASLLKTPIVMALFKYSESNPDILKKEITVKDSDVIHDDSQDIVYSGTIESGKKYTLLQIAESVIEKSDNAGVGIILRNIPEHYVSDVFGDSDVPFKDLFTELNVNVKDYAGFFRMLYNASYLNRDSSEHLLSMLSKSEFKDGIVAGVPEGTLVAHKFGERKIDDIKQLHDCGIIYYPGKPYIICIMTRGEDFKSEESAIKDISSYVYQQVSKNSSN